MKPLEDVFKQPDAAYRCKPFWAWNGKLEEPELRRQIRIMKQMGMGGAFMHSRVGLATPYLSREWFELTRAVVDECKRQGMEAWLYDEDRWPSGAAGGLVTRNPKHRQKRLVLEIDERGRPAKGDDVVAAFAARFVEGELAEPRRLRPGQRPRKGESTLVFRRKLAAPSDWYNGQTYLDTMSHEAVKRFIKVTHDAYAKHCGEEFGKTIPGIFTDEPNHGMTLHARQIDQLKTEAMEAPWTDRLPAVFRRRYGYDLLDHLPEIFFDVRGQAVSRARYHYHDCLAHLFVDAFARQIGEWCERHGLMHTGHILMESPMSGLVSVCSTAMRFYEHMQAPGIDILTKQARELDTAKACVSAARQCGRRWVLSELYGVTGWEFTLCDHKWVGDWQAALGINLRCPHLSWYTMEGDAKRDYPASILHQSPWWPYYEMIEDYYARVHVLMTRGEAVRDILVVHPIESMWLRCRVGWKEADDVRYMDGDLEQLRNWLLDAHLDFDYGDEEMMSRLARVERGREPKLRVGQARYKAVVAPPLITMRRTTLDLLRRFAKAGGRVVFVGDPPLYIDAEPTLEAAALAEMCSIVHWNGLQVVDALEPLRTVSIADADGAEFAPALYQLRDDGDAQYLFVCSRDQYESSGPLTIRLRAGKSVEEWDPHTGERRLADFKADKDGVVIRTELPGCGSRLFVIRRGKSALKRAPKRRVVRTRSLNPKSWPITLNEPNVLVLDRAEHRVGNAAWRPAEEVLRIDRAVRRDAGFIQRGGRRLQPWAAPPSDKKPVELSLRFVFQVDYVPSGRLALALEHPERFEIRLNGERISPDAADGWWVDRSIETVPVDPAVLRAGRNELILRTAYREEHNLEAVFLLGDFGVRLDGPSAALIEPPRELQLGDWTSQGLPFYSAAVTYRASVRCRPKPGERVLLRLGEYAASCVRVLVDGEPAGLLAWPPNECDLTDRLTGKTQELAIEVISSRRNAFGPLHRVPAVNVPTGPQSFATSGDAWTDEYSLAPYGLLAPPKLVFVR